jgi:peroxiredoxin
MKIAVLAVSALTLALASPAFAALKVGDPAPDFKLQAATDGKVKAFNLKAALKKGPVVVYFYPKAFTKGCSLEAHEFSVAMPKFKEKHVTVVGVSADTIDVLKDFSKKDCAGQFPVAADTNTAVAASYDAKIADKPMANRISYVVGQDGKIAFVHDDRDAATHVSSLLAAVGAG